jgi:ribokinase
MLKRFPKAATILTLGENGVVYAEGKTKISVPAGKVTAIDTTAAGDTFIAYFIAEKARGATIENCLTIATRAAGICVTRRGAADSIPLREEVDRN